MPLRVAFDLDGTVADMYSTLHQEALKLFGPETLAKADKTPVRAAPEADATVKIKEGDTPTPRAEDTATAMEELHLTARQQMQLWDHVKKIENFWTMLPELEPGIIARIAKAAAERRWEVIFFTTRPSTAGEMTQLQSQRWLEAHGFQYPSVYVVQRSRGKIADALQLDAFVDDRPENLLALENVLAPLGHEPGRAPHDRAVPGHCWHHRPVARRRATGRPSLRNRRAPARGSVAVAHRRTTVNSGGRTRARGGQSLLRGSRVPSVRPGAPRRFRRASGATWSSGRGAP